MAETGEKCLESELLRLGVARSYWPSPLKKRLRPRTAVRLLAVNGQNLPHVHSDIGVVTRVLTAVLEMASFGLICYNWKRTDQQSRSKVRFSYRLDGRNTDWQNAGVRRQAFFNYLAPGPYRFHVIACNNDGH